MPSYKNCLTGSESTIQAYPDLSIDAKTAVRFLNPKQFFKNYKYNDNDWKIISNMIFNLVKKFRENPAKLSDLINEFK